MADHDPLCQHDGPSWCECDLIARVRADEREKTRKHIAADIEVERDRIVAWNRDKHKAFQHQAAGYTYAARIARGES